MPEKEIMQTQIDALNSNLNRYIERAEAAQVIIFTKLEKAAEERKAILIQTTKTNGRVNALEAKCGTCNTRIGSLESEQKKTLNFQGRVGVVVGIIIAVITAALIAVVKSSA